MESNQPFSSRPSFVPSYASGAPLQSHGWFDSLIRFRLNVAFNMPETNAARWQRLCPEWAPPSAARAATACLRPQETNASRWQRLCPEWAPPSAARVSVSYRVDTNSHGAHAAAPPRGRKRAAPGSSSSASVYVNPPPGRADAPVIRHTRRGTTAAAVAALASCGSVTLVEELLRDRYARSASSTMASLAATWEFFHDQAFAHA